MATAGAPAEAGQTKTHLDARWNYETKGTEAVHLHRGAQTHSEWIDDLEPAT